MRFSVQLFDLAPLLNALLRPKFKSSVAESPEEYLKDLRQENSLTNFGPRGLFFRYSP